jgi:iron complex transport system permease protein
MIVLFSVLTVLIFFLSCGLGAYQASLPEVFRAIFLETEGTSRSIIWNVRVARSAVAACVGASLAISGAILQGVMRNPLASPSIIGVSAGAGLGAMIVLVVLPQYTFLLTPVAFLAGLIAALVIYSLAWKQGVDPLRMILAGIAVSSLLAAVSNTILIFYSDRVQSALGFIVGSLAARTWVHFRQVFPYALIGSFLAFLAAGRMTILSMGDELASTLGVNIERARLFFIALAALLAAASVSVVGILGFVGLIVPHVVRLIVGSDYRYLFPASAAFGAGLVILCDTFARVVVNPIEIPVGIVLAALGAPFFLYLLRTKSLRRV